ncbi:MAG: ribose 5-phosphate isomerase B [Deltaproteobacteria bacterium]|nr:ribose 5-phosphate isomerase B [Deltaproteobacteria bacterium]
MDIVIGSDHAGFDLKEACREHLEKSAGGRVEDAGVFSRDSADYPKVAHQMALAVAGGAYARGILICGTGLGMSIAANRHKGVRAALCHNLYTCRMSRLHNDANILVMGGRVIGVGIALEMVDLFLSTDFEGGRHLTRVDQIDAGC